MAFNRSFNEDFQQVDYHYVTVDLDTYFDQTKRPEHPPYSKLWGYVKYPTTPAGMLLWEDGTVKVVDTFYDGGYLTCDDAILGGHLWYTRSDSWQAQVLAAAGYSLVDDEGPIR